MHERARTPTGSGCGYVVCPIGESITAHTASIAMHAILLFSAVPLFVGAMLSDWAYADSYQIQWVNFASWFIVGGLVLAGLALLWGLIDFFRHRATRDRRAGLYLMLLLAGFGLGFINALIHAKDGWAVMPDALWLSALVLVLLLIASGLAWSSLNRRIV